MSKQDEIRQSLDERIKRIATAPTVLAIVKSVNENDKTCVLDEDGLEIIDVRLTPVIDDAQGLVIYPKLNTWALAVRIEHSNEWHLISCKEVFKYSLKVGATTFEITEAGVKIEKGNDSLKSCLNDMSKQMRLLTVPVVAVGSPSGVPVNAPAFAAIEKRINNILQ
jgi:hypothetical protein